jgi:apolipoprotein N-acyltransferase
MIRAANTGVTCFISEFGRITQILRDENGSTFGQGMLAGDINVPIAGPLTFYVRHGELFSEFCAGATLIGVAIISLRKLRARRSSPSPPNKV